MSKMLVLAVVVGSLAAGAEPVIERSLKLLEAAPPVCGESFDFIVTGDTQSNKQLVFQTDLFKGMIREFNTLKPSLVVEVGDLILGGSADGVPQQWDLFEEVIAACEPPYFPVPGNHDISDADTEKIWLERMGPTRYAFSYGNSRFIVLDSEEVDALDRLSDEQVAWFKAELEGTGAENIFVFLHQPYFQNEDDPRLMDETWAARWQYLADLMHGHPVRAVFAGHDHRYRDFGVRDGVRYALAAGGPVMNGREEEGRFSHYLLVRVRGTEMSWSVIKPGAVLPMDAATNARAAEVADIQRRLVSCEEMAVPIGEGFDRDVTIRVANPFDKGFDSTMTWDVPAGWTVEPASRDYTVAANGAAELVFRISAAGPESANLPAPAYKTRYLNTMFGEPVEVNAEIPFVPEASAPRAPGAPHTAGAVKIDGNLDEWGAAVPVKLNHVSGFDEGAYDPADVSGTCRAMWDEGNLYLAFEIDDDTLFQPFAGDIVWLADCIELAIDNSAWGFSQSNRGPEVFHYYGQGLSAETVNKDVRLGIVRGEKRTTYEAAFPAKVVKSVGLSAGSSFRLRALVSDVDTEGGRKHELALTPDGVSSGGVKMVFK